MLPWWGWVLLWAVLLLGAAVLVGLRVRRLWRSVRALGSEVTRASATVAALEARTTELRDEGARATAVTQDPHRLREQYRAARAEQAEARSARRAGRMPPWARVD